MKPQIVILLVQSLLASSFAPPANTIHTLYNHRRNKSPSSLFGTIRFVGNANARLSTQSIITNNNDAQDGQDKSLSYFLTTSASDTVLLGTTVYKQLEDDASSTNGVLWECQQGSVEWFGMQVIPIFINRIEKNPTQVVVSIIDAQTRVENANRLGQSLASVMERSKFEGRNGVTWQETDGENTTLEGNLELILEINLPRFLPIPPGFNRIGSKIVETTCKQRLRQNLRDIADAYAEWTDL